MSTLDDAGLADDEDFEEFLDEAFELLARIDDPAAVHALLRDGDDDAAFDRVDGDRADTENDLIDLYELAVELHERHPDAVGRLREDLGYYRPAAPSDSTDDVAGDEGSE